MVSYYNIKPGQDFGEIFDKYQYKNYLTLIYKEGPIKRWNFSHTQIRVFRIAFILVTVYLISCLLPYFEGALGLGPAEESQPVKSSD